MVRQNQKMHAWNQARKLKSDASMRDSAWIRLLKEAAQNGAGEVEFWPAFIWRQILSP